MSFLEGITVRDFVRDRLAQSGMGWDFTAGKDLRRTYQDVLLEGDLREALIRLNTEIAMDPARGDEVIYRLRAILLSVRTDGLRSAQTRNSVHGWLAIGLCHSD